MTKYYFFSTLESKLLDHHHQHQMVRFEPEFDNEFNIYFKIDKLVNIAMHFCVLRTQSVCRRAIADSEIFNYTHSSDGNIGFAVYFLLYTEAEVELKE